MWTENVYPKAKMLDFAEMGCVSSTRIHLCIFHTSRGYKTKLSGRTNIKSTLTGQLASFETSRKGMHESDTLSPWLASFQHPLPAQGIEVPGHTIPYYTTTTSSLQTCPYVRSPRFTDYLEIPQTAVPPHAFPSSTNHTSDTTPSFPSFPSF